MYEQKQEWGYSPLPCTVKCPLASSVVNKLPRFNLPSSALLCVLCVLLMRVFMSVHHYIGACGYGGVASVTLPLSLSFSHFSLLLFCS